MTRGIERPVCLRQCICRDQTALTLLHVGVAALCSGCKAKSAAAMWLWLVNTPTPAWFTLGSFSLTGCAMIHNNTSYDDFPDELSLRFRVHVLCAYAQSTLTLMEELAREGADQLDAETLKVFDSLAEQTERIWFEAAKIRTRVRAT